MVIAVWVGGMVQVVTGERGGMDGMVGMDMVGAMGIAISIGE